MIQILIIIGIAIGYLFIGYVVTRLLDEYLVIEDLEDPVIHVIVMIFFPIVLVGLVLRRAANIIVKLITGF